VEHDLERALSYGPRLADELVQPILVEVAVAISVGVDSMGGAGSLAVEANAEPNRFTLPPPSQHSMSSSAEGGTVEAITRAAHRHDAALIVAGTRGRGPLSAAFLGSVSAGLVRSVERASFSPQRDRFAPGRRGPLVGRISTQGSLVADLGVSQNP
jgi:Universal stress protein family